MQVRGANNPPEAARRGKTPIIQKKAVEASKNAMRDLSAGWLAVVLGTFTPPLRTSPQPYIRLMGNKLRIIIQATLAVG
jgi:hypothetical protein